MDPLLAVRRALEWSYDKLEFGTTHAFAACADWLALYRRYEGDWEKQLVCLGETVDHMAFDALRHPAFPFPPAGDVFDGQSFAAAVESVEREKARPW